MQDPGDINTDWQSVLSSLLSKLRNPSDDIIPHGDQIFRAFTFFNISEMKVVILGQDPYHTVYKNQPLADGLCFSVNPLCGKCPPSLKTIFKELEYEYGLPMRKNTDLSDWAKQGVLLLNTALTVERGKPGAHTKAWRPFTHALMEFITQNCKNVVYILWGEHAKSFKDFINQEENLILECRHPSGLAASKGPFIGNNHFTLANTYLHEHNKGTIKWV